MSARVSRTAHAWRKRRLARSPRFAICGRSRSGQWCGSRPPRPLTTASLYPDRIGRRSTRRRSGPTLESIQESAVCSWEHMAWWEVMAHGNLGDRPSGVDPTRRGRLGILSSAPVVAPRTLSYCDKGGIMKPSQDQVGRQESRMRCVKIRGTDNAPDLEADGKVKSGRQSSKKIAREESRQ